MCCHNISCDNMNSGFFSATLHLHAGNQQRRALREGASCQIPVSRMKILKLQRTGGIATSRVASDARVPPPVCSAPSRSLFLVRARGSRLPPWFQNQNRCAILRHAGTRFVLVVRAVQKYDIMRQHDIFFINVHSVRNAL